MKSTFLSLNARDFLKGLVIAILTPVFPIITESINAGSLIFNWHLIAVAAVGGFVAYMAKNFFTDGNKEAVKALEKQGATIIR